MIVPVLFIVDALGFFPLHLYMVGMLDGLTNRKVCTFFLFNLQVLHAFATEGAHCARVREVLNSSDVSNSLPQHNSLTILGIG